MPPIIPPLIPEDDELADAPAGAIEAEAELEVREIDDEDDAAREEDAAALDEEAAATEDDDDAGAEAEAEADAEEAGPLDEA